MRTLRPIGKWGDRQLLRLARTRGHPPAELHAVRWHYLDGTVSKAHSWCHQVDGTVSALRYCHCDRPAVWCGNRQWTRRAVCWLACLSADDRLPTVFEHGPMLGLENSFRPIHLKWAILAHLEDEILVTRKLNLFKTKIGVFSNQKSGNLRMVCSKVSISNVLISRIQFWELFEQLLSENGFFGWEHFVWISNFAIEQEFWCVHWNAIQWTHSLVTDY